MSAINLKRPEVIRVVQDYTTRIVAGEYKELIRQIKPGSITRDGEYGYTSS